MTRLSTIRLLFLAAWIVHPAGAQTSQHALRFFGTGVGPPGQQDRALFPVDDNVVGGASTAIDIGTGSFTLEFWLRGELSDNATANNGGDSELFDFSWIDGNIILDRDIWCGSERKYGISIAGGLVRFGTAAGDSPDTDFSNNTIEGSTLILDGEWHHVAAVRDTSSGTKHIYVDGELDFSSSAGVSFADLSYPDDGVPVTGDCGTGQLTPYGWFLVLAAEKHDAGEAFPSFSGFVDELRIWNVARSDTELAATFDRLVPPSTPGLAAVYRFEEGSGTVLGDSGVLGAPSGDLVTGLSGNGEWVSFADDPLNTAPVTAADTLFVDGFESGTTLAWSTTVNR